MMSRLGRDKTKFAHWLINRPPRAQPAVLAHHTLAQRTRADRTDRPFLIMQEAIDDGDALGALMARHLEAHPFRLRQAAHIDGGVAVDEPEALVAEVRERAR